MGIKQTQFVSKQSGGLGGVGDKASEACISSTFETSSRKRHPPPLLKANEKTIHADELWGDSFNQGGEDYEMRPAAGMRRLFYLNRYE
ncbi:hypothetical protein DHL47_05820 [Streptococcus panodentis]|uniref:Uncharacterized protein n=1 Tax=Streptococcus panodentis TaxID=1581472 RepID=A0ABS5AWA8_9STRE|nr:hypothetical protein [Streptococcus panodentis]